MISGRPRKNVWICCGDIWLASSAKTCRHWGGWLDHVLQAMLPSIVYVPDRRLWIGTRTRHQPFSHNYRTEIKEKTFDWIRGVGLTKWVGRFKNTAIQQNWLMSKTCSVSCYFRLKPGDWGFEVWQHVMMQKFSPEKFVWHAAWVWIQVDMMTYWHTADIPWRFHRRDVPWVPPAIETAACWLVDCPFIPSKTKSMA